MLDIASPPDPVDAGDHRDTAAVERDHVADERDGAGDLRDDAACARDVASEHRDAAAVSRDEAADLRDAYASHRERTAAGRELAESGADALHRSARARHAAAADRTRASEDRLAGAGAREEAERDRSTAHADRSSGATERKRAGRDRGAAARDRADSSLDDLTGAYVRGPGLLQLEREVMRAQRMKQELTVAFLDVDHLKSVNDLGGHAAGDRLLARVGQALRRRLRPYDLVIRYGGDEFVCVLAGVGQTEAERRFATVNADLDTHGSVTVGIVTAHAEETSTTVIARADAALYARRAARPLAD